MDDISRKIQEELYGIDPRAAGHLELLISHVSTLQEVFTSSPSLFESRFLTEQTQSPEKLQRRLCSADMFDILLPTKVSIGSSMLTAKFNMYGFLFKLAERYEQLQQYDSHVLTLWEDTLFNLLLEEVYRLILRRRHLYAQSVVDNAALELIRLWESRDERHAAALAAPIIALWSSRKRLVPLFGTMLGTQEVMRISSRLPAGWEIFIKNHSRDEEFIRAMEEFLFGLSFEQIFQVRTLMKTGSIHTVSRDDIFTLLKSEPILPPEAKEDPRSLYLFFQKRNMMAEKRNACDLKGPERTLEEFFLAHLLGNV
jgi:hypothetical protein